MEVKEGVSIMDALMEKIGNRIKEIREREGLSQEELAEKMGISRVAVSQIENGKRKICTEELIALSKIFNVSTDILLDLEKDIEVIFEKSKKEKPGEKQEIRISVPQKNVEKFKEVLLYILGKVGSKPNIGQTVLYKLLYFIDFNYYEKYEEQLIGATYIKNHHGPTPKEFIKIVKEMEGKDLVKIQDKYFKYPQTKYIPLRDPDLSKLNARELSVIDDVLNKLADMNASQISAYSHNDVPWMTTEEGDVIDYESVFYRTTPYSVREYSEEREEVI
ncbi:MAG: type II toxin-antitoxin system antitoxin SocA domain-containing protein [Methanosarcina sp.]